MILEWMNLSRRRYPMLLPYQRLICVYRSEHQRCHLDRVPFHGRLK